MFGRVNVSGSMKNFNMSNFVPPSANAEDAFEIMHMEGLESLYNDDGMESMSRNRNVDRDTNGFVDCHFGRCPEVLV